MSAYDYPTPVEVYHFQSITSRLQGAKCALIQRHPWSAEVTGAESRRSQAAATIPPPYLFA